MMMLKTFLPLALAAAIVTPAAAVIPHASAGDPRIEQVLYDPTQVIEITGTLGYQLSIEFDPGERIENVAIGDGLGWQVTPNKRANLLFLKPMSRRPKTNMTVVTNARRYDFELTTRAAPQGRRGRPVAYSLRILYPAPAAVAVVTPEPEPVWAPQVANQSYSYKGSAVNLPARVFDDGQFTYFTFQKGTDFPAILAVEADGGELVVNSTMREGYVIVDTVARGFVLRRGSEVTTLYNDGFRETQPGPQSPTLRAKKTGWFRK